MDDPRSDHELLRAAQAEGDDDAYDTFVQRWLHKVWEMAMAQTRNRDVADDAVQAVFLSLQRRLANPAPIEVPASYLRSMVRNEIRRSARAAARAETSIELVEDLDERADPADDFEAWVDAAIDLDVRCCWLQAIATAVSERSADIAFLLQAGFSPAEIVAKLDDVENVDAVYRTKNRIKTRWDAVIQEHDRQPVLHEWAVHRWGCTGRKEAT